MDAKANQWGDETDLTVSAAVDLILQLPPKPRLEAAVEVLAIVMGATARPEAIPGIRQEVLRLLDELLDCPKDC